MPGHDAARPGVASSGPDVVRERDERPRRAAILERLCVWLACAGAIGILWSPALAAALRGA